MFCVDAHFADEKTEVHGAAFNYLAKVTHPGEWWSQDWKPGSQTPECKLLANWKAYVEHLQCSTHCTKPFDSLASFSAFANLMGYIFIPSLLWVSRLKMRTVSSPVGIWPFRLPSLCSVHSPPWHGPGTPPTHPPELLTLHFSAIMFWTYRLVAKTTTQKQHERQMTFQTFCSQDGFFFNF